jgi:hypothetical protein
VLLVAVAVRLVGAVGDAVSLLTVSVTVTSCGLLTTPVTLTVMVPLYVPTASPLVFTESAGVPGVVPPLGVTLTQFPPLAVETVAVQFNANPPVFVMERLWLAGLTSCIALKLIVVGAVENTGSFVQGAAAMKLLEPSDTTPSPPRAAKVTR